MEILRKQRYIARDGREFENQQDCMNWERSLLTPRLIHLKDEQIVKLFNAALITPFKEWPEDYDTKFKLYVRRHFEDNGFAFWFTY
ncbi:MAG: hypothetical protein JWR50_3490 [Mucilaginibacter sp.]|nr:hypothetical protein [Mucilaginibacter sp.]